MESIKTAALFDLDGVVTDTEPQYSRFWAAIGQRMLPHIPDFAARIKGQTLTFIMANYFPEAEQQRDVQAALDEYEEKMDYPLVEGALRFVESLRAAGIPAAVATSSNRAKMEQVYRRHPHLKPLFREILTAEDSENSKPAPDCYLNAARRLGVDIKDCVVFEDSFNGLRAARVSGAYVVGLTTSHPEADIAPMTDAVIPDFGMFTVGDMLSLLAHSRQL